MREALILPARPPHPLPGSPGQAGRCVGDTGDEPQGGGTRAAIYQPVGKNENIPSSDTLKQFDDSGGPSWWTKDHPHLSLPPWESLRPRSQGKCTKTVTGVVGINRPKMHTHKVHCPQMPLFDPFPTKIEALGGGVSVLGIWVESSSSGFTQTPASSHFYQGGWRVCLLPPGPLRGLPRPR